MFIRVNFQGKGAQGMCLHLNNSAANKWPTLGMVGVDVEITPKYRTVSFSDEQIFLKFWAGPILHLK